jgi:hypothetical protein
MHAAGGRTGNSFEFRSALGRLEHAELMTRAGETPHQPGPDEAATARDQNLHCVPHPITTRKNFQSGEPHVT